MSKLISVLMLTLMLMATFWRCVTPFTTFLNPIKHLQAQLNIVPNMASDAFQSRQHYPRNVEEFNQRFPDNAYNTIHTLTETNGKASGRRWNVKHLEACRVLLSQPQSRPPHPQPHHLTVLEPYLERARAQLERTPVVYQSLVAVTPKRLKQCSHQEL